MKFRFLFQMKLFSEFIAQAMDEKKAEIWGKKIFSYYDLLFVNKTKELHNKLISAKSRRQYPIERVYFLVIKHRVAAATQMIIKFDF